MQQWWRQLCSAAHQQRCGWRQMSAESGLEQARGEEAGAAALVEAAPLAGSRGGTGGWGGNRASGWSRWQRVLLVLLVWLVVPVEAAGAAQAAGGVAAAAAAAAAAASTLLNYWAGTGDDTTGDLEVMSKGWGVSGSCLRT